MSNVTAPQSPSPSPRVTVEVVETDTAHFDAEVLASPVPVLVDFATPWCAPCRALEPTLHGLARAHAGKLRVVRVDADANPEIAQRYRVRGFPTVIAFAGGEERGRHVGVTNAATLLGLAGLAER